MRVAIGPLSPQLQCQKARFTGGIGQGVGYAGISLSPGKTPIFLRKPGSFLTTDQKVSGSTPDGCANKIRAFTHVRSPLETILSHCLLTFPSWVRWRLDYFALESSLVLIGISGFFSGTRLLTYWVARSEER